MAITTTTITKSAGWARTDLLYQLEEAFTWLGWNGETQTGIVTGISAYSGGGTVGSVYEDYYDVFPATTTGIGTGASFYVDRDNGSINYIYVNRPGVGYTDGEYVTLSAEDIGGSASGATGIGITVQVAGGGSPVGYGTTTAFYDSDISGTYPWGVLRHTIQDGKRFGDTYRSFQAISNTQISIGGGSSFHPWDTTKVADRGNLYRNRFAGNERFDIGAFAPIVGQVNLELTTSGIYYGPQITTLTVSSSNSYQLDLNIYRSGLDPNFVVFSYKQPTLSSLAIDDNSFATFFFHNFTTSLWDLDYLFLGGFTNIVPEASPSTTPHIDFYGYFGNANSSRSAEWGYSTGGSNTYVLTAYHSASYPHNNPNEATIYNRSADNSKGGKDYTETLNSNTFYNAVIKGIPLSTCMVPCPYYLPDDFVLIDFKFDSPSANIQQGDTVTISGSEVYTVITGSYNQTTSTRGILFCARTV